MTKVIVLNNCIACPYIKLSVLRSKGVNIYTCTHSEPHVIEKTKIGKHIDLKLDIPEWCPLDNIDALFQDVDT